MNGVDAFFRAVRDVVRRVSKTEGPPTLLSHGITGAQSSALDVRVGGTGPGITYYADPTRCCPNFEAVAGPKSVFGLSNSATRS